MANGEGTYNSTRCVPPSPEVDGEVFDLFTTSGFMGWKTRDKLIEKRINIVKERVIGSSSTIKHCWYNMLTIHLRAMQEKKTNSNCTNLDHMMQSQLSVVIPF